MLPSVPQINCLAVFYSRNLMPTLRAHPFQQLLWITARFPTAALRCTSGEDKLNYFKSNFSTSCFYSINFSPHLFALIYRVTSGNKIKISFEYFEFLVIYGNSHFHSVSTHKGLTVKDHTMGTCDLREEKVLRIPVKPTTQIFRLDSTFGFRLFNMNTILSKEPSIRRNKLVLSPILIKKLRYN